VVRRLPRPGQRRERQWPKRGPERAIVVGMPARMPVQLDSVGTDFDLRGALYVASAAGIIELGVRGGEKRWWDEARRR
jgi:hypothetical protein